MLLSFPHPCHPVPVVLKVLVVAGLDQKISLRLPFLVCHLFFWWRFLNIVMRNVRIIWKYQGDPPFKDHNLDPFRHRVSIRPYVEDCEESGLRFGHSESNVRAKSFEEPHVNIIRHRNHVVW
jgi:hypothetical protein